MPVYRIEKTDCFEWLRQRPAHSLNAVCTDPPYGILEFAEKEISKLRAGRGGVWLLPPKVGAAIAILCRASRCSETSSAISGGRFARLKHSCSAGMRQAGMLAEALLIRVSIFVCAAVFRGRYSYSLSCELAHES